MTDPVSSSNPRHVIFIFLITTTAMVVQMHFPNSSPSDKYPVNLWIFMACLFLYAFSSAYCKSQASTSDNDSLYSKLSSHITVISGSMACVALISVLVSKPGLAVIIIIHFMWLLIYFAPNQVMEICKKIGSYVYALCKRIEYNGDDPADNMELGMK